MNNIGSMKCGETISHLSSKYADLFFSKWGFFFSPFYHKFQKISTLGELSNKA